jgi:hypothetical protein
LLQLARSDLCSPHPSVIERTLRAPATIKIIQKQETNKSSVVSKNEKKEHLHYMYTCNMYVKIEKTAGKGQEVITSKNVTEKVKHYLGTNFPNKNSPILREKENPREISFFPV